MDVSAQQMQVESGPMTQRADELIEIINAYNQVTARLQESHELLNSEVRRLQGELASANAALQRSKRLAALGEMAAGIAHEIRNPLGSIQLYANMLEEDLADRPEQCDIARKIAEGVRGLNGIVNDVLTFSREMRVRPMVGSAGDVILRVIEAMRPMIEQARVTVKIVGRIDAVELAYDRELFHQAMVNLVRNALEAMDEGGVLTLEAVAEAEEVRLTVRDTGPGIEEAAIDRIFNPFFTTRQTGTGLGLAIVHRIVDAHGGTIAVHNDGGAVFTLTLPNVKASALAGAGV